MISYVNYDDNEIMDYVYLFKCINELIFGIANWPGNTFQDAFLISLRINKVRSYK